MIKTEILSVGTELLMGQIVNTDAGYISARLPEAGAGVYYHTVVGDNPDRLRDCLLIALGRADIVITTGGLGPTQDDLTKQTIAAVLGLGLREHKETRESIDAYFSKRGKKATENNYRQAMMPEGAEILTNVNGTAPGCMIRCGNEFSGKIVFMLPGPPDELKPMFDSYVMKYYMDIAEQKMHSAFVRICGTGESAVETKLSELIDGQTNPTLATYVKTGVVTVRVTASAECEEKAVNIVDVTVEKIKNLLGDDVYSTSNEEPEETLVRLLKEKNMTVSTAESLTAGMISAKIASVPGASKVLVSGITVYTDEAKNKLLGVKQKTLTDHTAVSAETCREMAEGVRRLTGSDFSIAVTGYAGPQVEDEPVGLVYIGIAAAHKTFVKECHFAGSRERIRTLTAVNSIDLTRRMLLELSSTDAVKTGGIGQ